MYQNKDLFRIKTKKAAKNRAENTLIYFYESLIFLAFYNKKKSYEAKYKSSFKDFLDFIVNEAFNALSQPIEYEFEFSDETQRLEFEKKLIDSNICFSPISQKALKYE